MTFQILLSPPDVGGLERDYVLRAITSGWVAPAGPDLDAFESEIAERVGVEHAVGMSSGTAALHMALVSWGVKPGDVVVAPTLTFAATVNAIRYVGAEPHFVDCDEESGNMDSLLLRRALDCLESNGRNVAAVIPVDLMGKCANYEAIEREMRGRNIRMLCDAAEAFGASRGGRAAGSFGDAAVLSFNGNKILTTSGGGMLLTDDADLAAHTRKLSTQAREPVIHYEHREVGYNYRLSNILAALGRAQLVRFDGMMLRRRTWRQKYRELFDPFEGVRLLGGTCDAEDNGWLTAIVVEEQVSGWTAASLGEALRERGIETRPIWKPMHLQPIFRGYDATLTGAAERLFLTGLVLPSGSAMTDADFDHVSRTIVHQIASAQGGK